MIPDWARDPKIACKTINARVETAPSYRRAFKKRRCLVPADGFYERKKVLGGKIPLLDKNEGQFPIRLRWVMARAGKIRQNDEWLHACTIITGEPNQFVREINTRMPVILPEEHHDAWLSHEARKEVLLPYGQTE